MVRKNILWLCSWYPGKTDLFNGDFIQRHALAASLYNDIQVIHVAGDEKGIINDKMEEEFHESPGLREHIIYFKRGSSFIGKIMGGYRWLKLYHRAIKKYVSENGPPDLVHIHVPMRAGLFAIRMKKRFGIPYVVTEHWTIYQPQNVKKFRHQNASFKWMLHRIVKHSRLLLPVSRDLGLLMNKLVAKKAFLVVENVVNDKYFYHAEYIKMDSTFRFIHVSNMTYQKNAGPIIECFFSFQQKFPNVELVIVGIIPEEIKQLVGETGLLNKKIFLRGEINYVAVAGEMQQSNALVMFSRFENSPCSIIEALCCGLPVIATNVGGIPELLDSNNGLLIEPLDKKALLKAFEVMTANYSTYDREKIAEDAKNKFSYSVIGKKLDEIYTDIVSDKC